jgi:ABC-type multidrug transport system fused ATPase/permease subunit
MSIAIASVAAGIAEAGVLALAALAASSMSTGTEVSTLVVGPLAFRASVTQVVTAAFALAAIRLVLQVVVARLPARLSGRVQTQLRTELFDSFLGASWKERQREKEGHLQELMGGQALLAGGAVLQLATGFSSLLMLSMLAVSAFLLNAATAAGVMVTAVALFAGLRPLSRRVRRFSATTSEASMAQAFAVAEVVRASREVEVFGVRAKESTRIAALVRSVEERFVRTRALAALAPVIYQSAVIFLLLGGLALLGAIEPNRFAALGAVVLLLVRASSYGQRLLTAYQGLGESLPYLDRLAAAIQRYRSEAPPQGTVEIDEIRTIELRDASFGYRPEALLLSGISFRVIQGETIGIVGPSGAGKSTLLDILVRLQRPTSGIYLLNGIDANEITDTVWHRKVAYLPQEPHLLSGTVTENIRFRRDWVSDADVEWAARAAHIEDDILQWKDAYATIIGHRADAVSGGQRQRLCLARALAGQPHLLVLDEPTSALDPKSEALIRSSLQSLRGALTIVIVAHAMSTLALCDRVMVINDGRLEAFGAPHEVYESSGFFREALAIAASRGVTVGVGDGPHS